MSTRLPIIFIAALAAGCATSGRANLPAEDFGGATGLELVIQNERTSVVTAYIQWTGSREVRLGEVRGGRTETFTTPMRGREMRVTFGNPGRSGSQAGTGYVVVTRGDRMEWTITPTGVFYRRLNPN